MAVLGLVSAPSAAETVDRRIGQRVENFSSPDFPGSAHALDDYRDRIVVLAFLAPNAARELYVLRLNDWPPSSRRRGCHLSASIRTFRFLTEIGAFVIASCLVPIFEGQEHQLADRLGAVHARSIFWIESASFATGDGSMTNTDSRPEPVYLKSKLDERSLADAIRQVLLGKTSRILSARRRMFIGPRGQGRSVWGSHVCESR